MDVQGWTPTVSVYHLVFGLHTAYTHPSRFAQASLLGHLPTLLHLCSSQSHIKTVPSRCPRELRSHSRVGQR